MSIKRKPIPVLIIRLFTEPLLDIGKSAKGLKNPPLLGPHIMMADNLQLSPFILTEFVIFFPPRGYKSARFLV